MMPFQAMRLRKPAGGAGAWATAYSGAIGGTISTGWSGYTMRQVIPAASTLAGSKVRLTLNVGSGVADIGAVFVGRRALSGDPYDFDSTPVSVLFSGSPGISVPGSTDIVSDEASLVVDGMTDLVVSVYFSGVTSLYPVASIGGGFGNYYIAGNDASTVDASGYSMSGTAAFLFRQLDVFQP